MHTKDQQSLLPQLLSQRHSHQDVGRLGLPVGPPLVVIRSTLRTHLISPVPSNPMDTHSRQG
jgi:hypothetical protein